MLQTHSENQKKIAKFQQTNSYLLAPTQENFDTLTPFKNNSKNSQEWEVLFLQSSPLKFTLRNIKTSAKEIFKRNFEWIKNQFKKISESFFGCDGKFLNFTSRESPNQNKNFVHFLKSLVPENPHVRQFSF